MNTWTGLSTLIALYILFSTILWNAFHTMIMFIMAGIAAALVGLVISLLLRGSKA